MLTVPVSGQDKSHQNWWFGNTVNGIQFSQPDYSAVRVTRPALTGPFGNNGSAVASDQISGALMFYTDGETIYDATHRPMPTGGGLTGDSNGGQPAVICRIPGQTSRYYVVTNTAVTGTPGSLSFTVVDMSLIGNNVSNPTPSPTPLPPLGDVDPAMKNQPIALTNEAEAMVIVKHANETDYWLITQTPNSTLFKVTLISAGGFSAPATGTTPAPDPSNPSFVLPSFTAAHFAYDTANRMLAVTPVENSRSVMLFQFDETAGTLIQAGTVALSASASGSVQPVIYDIAWSNTGNYLYVSYQGDAVTNGQLVQFDLVNPTVSPEPITVPNMVRSYGLQLGADSSLYHLYQTTAGGPILAGRVNDPDSVASLARYQDQLFGGAQFGARQFPSFLVAHPPVIAVDFTWSGECANMPTQFYPSIVPGADSVRWSFGETPPQGSTAVAPIHTYTNGGTFTVTLTAFVNGEGVTVSHDVPITDFDLSLSLVQDTIACSCELRFPKNDTDPSDNASDRYQNGSGGVCPDFALTAQPQGTATSYQWYGPGGLIPGMTSQTLSYTDSAGFYYVIAQGSVPGCYAFAGVNIEEYGVPDPRANIWHFGNNAGLNFNDDFVPATPVDPIEGPTTAPEGVATISDRNGQVIFTTDGVQVWDRQGTALLTGVGLNGATTIGPSASTQSAFIIPFPQDPTRYYIFVTQQVYPQETPGYELRYAIFDLTQGDYGNVIDPDGNPANGVSAVLFTRSTERLTGDAGWLIAHEYGNNNFRAYPITGNGIGAPVISSVGSDHSVAFKEHAEGYMKLTGTNIVVALSTPVTQDVNHTNVIEFLDFNNTTGEITNARQILIPQTDGQVYGLAVSGNRLFATTRLFSNGAGQSMLHEFVFDTASNTFTRPGGFNAVDPAGELGAIEQGPDGTIYVAVNGAGALGTIQPQGDLVTPSTFQEAAQPLSPTVPPGGSPTSTLGLPNFIQSIATQPLNPSIAFTTACVNVPIDFTGSGTSIIDTLVWDFGDGQRQEGANLTAVQHTYSTAGDYTVRLTIKNRCAGLIGSIDTLITISPNPVALDGAMAICDGTETIAATATVVSGDTYLWITQETTHTIRPAGDGEYRVTVTNAAGCQDEGTWFVVDIRPEIDLGPDLVLCQGTAGPRFDFSSEGDNFQWTRNGATFSTAPALTIHTATPGTWEYIIEVDNSFTGCTASDTAEYVINERPDFDTTPHDPTACNTETGSIDIKINSGGTYSYLVTGRSTPPGGSNITGPTVTDINVGPLFAGAYNVEVTDQVSGCFDQRTVSLSDPGFTADIARAQSCNDPDGLMPVLITTIPTQTDFVYTIYQGVSTNVVLTGDDTMNPEPRVRNGSYVVQIQSPPSGPTMCTVVSPVRNIRQDTEVPINDIIQNVCTEPFTLEAVAPSATTIDWTASTSPILSPVPPNNTAIVEVGESSSVQSFTVRVSGGAGTCPQDTTFSVNVGADPPAAITQSSACEDFVLLDAAPLGSEYDYRWSNGEFGQQIFADLADNGTSVTVTVRNGITTCQFTSPAHDIIVLGELTVDLAAPDQTCQGTPYDLIATANQTPDEFQWELDGDALGETGNTLTVDDDSEGKFIVTIERTSGVYTCTAKDSVVIDVAPTTPGFLPETGVICPGAPDDDPEGFRDLDPGPGFINWAWFEGSSSDTVSTDAIYRVFEPGTYRVALLNLFNCPSSDEITLEEECNPKIAGPNAFRPGGLNTEFGLFTFFIDEASFEIYIFNRWGEMVYYDDTPDFKWNGGYKNNAGEPLPAGTYSYLVKYKSSYRPELGTLEYRGGVVLLR